MASIAVALFAFSSTSFALHHDTEQVAQVAIDPMGAIAAPVPADNWSPQVAELGASGFGEQHLSLLFEPEDEDDEDDEEAPIDEEEVPRSKATSGDVALASVGSSWGFRRNWESKTCQTLKLRQLAEHYFMWASKMPVIYSEKYEFGYMKTPGVASEEWWNYFLQKFPDAKPIYHTGKRDFEFPARAYIFTFVQQPFRHKLAAYAQVNLKDHLLEGYGAKQKTVFQNVQRDEDSGRARFAAFLDDIESGRFHETDKRNPVSAASQIAGPLHTAFSEFGLNVAREIGHLENVGTHWREIQHRARLPKKMRTKAYLILNDYKSKRNKKARVRHDENIPLNSTLKEQICRMYASEFVCLGYPAPPSCEMLVR